MTRRPHHRSQRASMAAVVAVSMFVLLGFAALVIDIGALYHVQAQFQIACDATALSGASHIDGTGEGLDRATEAAYGAGTLNTILGEPIPADELHLEFGLWDGASGQFIPTNDVEVIDAIRVHSEPRGVSTPLAGVAWGLGLNDVSASAIGIRPPPEPVEQVDCFLPVAMPLCTYEQIEAGGHPWVMSFQLANDSSDTLAWAHPGGASAANVSDALQAIVDGECPGAGVEIGDPVPMTNGVQAGTLIDIRRLLLETSDPWDTSLWGGKPVADEFSAIPDAKYPGSGVIQGPVAVFEQEGAACGSIKFNQTEPLERFVWGVLFDVYSGPGQHKGGQLYIDMEHDFETPGTGGSGGTGNVKARPPGQLVN